MATLSAAELGEIRKKLARGVTVMWSTPQANAALQAIEDYFEDTAKAGLNSAIEGAASGVFTAAQKKKLVAFFILQKSRRESV